MTFCCCKIDQSASSEKMDSPTIFEFKCFVIFSDCVNFLGSSLKIRDIYLAIIVSSITDNCSFFHRIEMTPDNYVFHSCCRAEYIANMGCFIHLHDSIAIHYGFQSSNWVYLGYNHISTHTTCSIC